MLIAQVATNWNWNIVLSLLRSLPLSALGWHMKRKSQDVVIGCDETSVIC